MNPEDCSAVDEALLPGAGSVAALLKSRRSVRKFSEQLVDAEILADLVDVARYAPTGSNEQQVHWTVFQEPEEVKRIAALLVDWAKLLAEQLPDPLVAARMAKIAADWDDGKDDLLRGAPHLIVVHGPVGVPCIQADCHIALTYLELYAFSNGLGTCWGGYLNAAANSHPPVSKALNLPKGHKCFGAAMVGYPCYKYHLIPKREPAHVAWR
jgi:nitroreductase